MHLFNTQTNVGNKHLQQNIFTAHRLPCRSFNCVNFEINLNAQRRLIKRFQLFNRYLGNVVVKNCKSTFFLKAFTVKIAFGTFTCNKRKICTLTLQTKSCNITSLPMKKATAIAVFSRLLPSAKPTNACCRNIVEKCCVAALQRTFSTGTPLFFGKCLLHFKIFQRRN